MDGTFDNISNRQSNSTGYQCSYTPYVRDKQVGRCPTASSWVVYVLAGARRGYARHRLVPKGLAAFGTWENIDVGCPETGPDDRQYSWLGEGKKDEGTTRHHQICELFADVEVMLCCIFEFKPRTEIWKSAQRALKELRPMLIPNWLRIPHSRWVQRNSDVHTFQSDIFEFGWWLNSICLVHAKRTNGNHNWNPGISPILSKSSNQLDRFRTAELTGAPGSSSHRTRSATFRLGTPGMVTPAWLGNDSRSLGSDIW